VMLGVSGCDGNVKWVTRRGGRSAKIWFDEDGGVQVEVILGI
jgi:hypothetical protein